MTVTLKKGLGEGGMRFDKSYDDNNLYQVLLGIAQNVNQLVSAMNTLVAEYNAETVAAHTTSAVTPITPNVEVD